MPTASCLTGRNVVLIIYLTKVGESPLSQVTGRLRLVGRGQMVNPNAFRIELPCPNCGKIDLQMIGELVGKDMIACRVCAELIDLTNEKWQAGLREMIEGLREIYVVPR